MKQSAQQLIVLGLLVATGCAVDFSSTTSEQSTHFQDIIAQFGLAPLPAIPYPPNNQHNPDRIALGRLLFFDPILGGESGPAVKEAVGLDPFRFRENDVACGTCHLPELGFTDGRPLSAGVSGAQFDEVAVGPNRIVPGLSIVSGSDVGIVPRNAPSMLNTGLNGRNSRLSTSQSFMFLDGRVTGGLEELAEFPVMSRDEMAGDAFLGAKPEEILDSITNRIREIPGYVTLFRDAFPGEVAVADDITIDHITRAIAAFARELITPGSRYDQFVAGDFDVFTAEEREGFVLFFEQGDCGGCHAGPMLSDYTFRVIGAGDAYDQSQPGFEGKNGNGGDFGRWHADSSVFSDMRFAFRVLTVRNAEVTGPFFHSGSAATLLDVVDFYNRGGRGPVDLSDDYLASYGVTRDPLIRPLGLSSSQMASIVAFMKTTSAPVQAGPEGLDLASIPDRVPSGLVPPGVPTPSGLGPFR